jgi:chromosome partitioning protein
MGLFNRATKPDWSTELAEPNRDELIADSDAEQAPELDVPSAAEDASTDDSTPESEAGDESTPQGDPDRDSEPAPEASADSADPAEPAEPVEEQASPSVEERLAPDGEASEPPEDEQRISASEALSPSRSASAGIPGAKIGDEVERRVKIISFANQKGGVAKTTTTLNLAVAFAESGHRVLAVDLDPQGNLTMSQGIDPDQVETSMYDVLVDHIPIRDVIAEREIDIAVASIDLAGAEIAMSMQIGRERSLEKALSAVIDDYDFICIDTPPSLGLLTVNALTASDKVIVPVQCEYLSMRGLIQLQNTLEMIRENLNPRVQIEGILPTMLDSRTVHAKEAVEILEENFGELVFKSRIRKAIKFAEAPVRGSSVLKYDPKGNAAKYYRELAQEVLTHGAS